MSPSSGVRTLGRETGLGFANSVIGLVMLDNLALRLGSVLLAPTDRFEAFAPAVNRGGNCRTARCQGCRQQSDGQHQLS